MGDSQGTDAGPAGFAGAAGACAAGGLGSPAGEGEGDLVSSGIASERTSLGPAKFLKKR